MKLTIPTLLLASTLLLSTQSNATTLIDPFYNMKNSCISKISGGYDGQIFSEKYKKGIFAHYDDEKNMIALLNGLYGCDIIESELNDDGIVYFSFTTWEKDKNGVPKTLFDTINKSNKLRLNIDKNTKLYSSLEELLQSENFKQKIKKDGEEWVYIQALDIWNLSNAGFYNSQGEMVLDKYNQPTIQ